LSFQLNFFFFHGNRFFMLTRISLRLLIKGEVLKIASGIRRQQKLESARAGEFLGTRRQTS
jgi:hypothetical protein